MPPVPAANPLNRRKLVSSLVTSFGNECKLPILEGIKPTGKRTVLICAVVLQDFLQKRLRSSIDTHYRFPDDVLVEGGRHQVTHVVEHSRFRFQTHMDRFDDSMDRKTRMLARNPVRVQRLRGRPEVISFDRVTVIDWLRILTTEERG